MTPSGGRRLAWACAPVLFGFVAIAGCGGVELVPVQGTARYNEQPLEYGSVMFQPVGGGEIARGTIQPDGSFQLALRDGSMGAAPGTYLVRVTAYEAQRAQSFGATNQEPALGRSAIPERYTNFRTSGLEVVVAPNGPAGGAAAERRIVRFVVPTRRPSHSHKGTAMTVRQPRLILGTSARDTKMEIRREYETVKTLVEAAGFFVTDMSLDGGGDRIVCAGLRRPQGGYTGNSFWLAERNGKWLLGTWGGSLYRLTGADHAFRVSVAWLKRNSATTDPDVPSELKSQFDLVPANNDDFEDA